MAERLERAIAAIDAVNAEDPNEISVRGERGPKELLHARLVTEWVEQLQAEPSELLRIAARAHHLRRWGLPRSDYPTGRSGYLRWRKELQRRHAAEVGEIMAGLGYRDEEVERVQAIVQKRGLGRDADVQALEDAMCLVFLETQLTDVADKLDDEDKVIDVLRKTARKMSPDAIARASSLPLDERGQDLLQRATSPLVT